MLKKRGKKLVLWTFLALLLIGLATGAGYLTHQVNDRKADLAETIRTHPDTTAMVTYTFDKQGEPVEDGQALYYNADTPLVLASTMKVAILAAYEYAVVQGEVDPGELVLVADLEKYYLPKTDGNAHIQGLAGLGIKTDALGFARDQMVKLSIDDIASIMIHYSGNAEADYLIERLGVEKINSIPGLDHQTPIRPILGTALAIMDHEGSYLEAGKLVALVKDVERGDFSSLDRLVDLYLHDPEWRASQIEFMRSGEYIAAASKLGWDGQVEASHLFPKGTAREYASLMAKIASGQYITPEVSGMMQKKLESVPSEWPLRRLFFQRFGAKSGVTAGVLNLASYAFTEQGSKVGQGRVVVILTNDLTYETWSSQLQYEGAYLLQIDLARKSRIFNWLASSQ